MRFEVFVNGEKLCLAGLDGQGFLETYVTRVKMEERGSHPNDCLKVRTYGVGQRWSTPKAKEEVHVSWSGRKLRIGDEVTVRILPPGEFDPPLHLQPKKKQERLDDPLFGELVSHYGRWEASESIEHVGEPAHHFYVHVYAGDSGPSEQQRQFFRDLQANYAVLWEEQILGALCRCSRIHNDPDPILQSLSCEVSVTIYEWEEPALVEGELSYCCESEGEEDSGYYVRIRNWEIVEIYTGQ